MCNEFLIFCAGIFIGCIIHEISHKTGEKWLKHYFKGIKKRG